MINVPSYFRLCPNLVASSLLHWLHMGRLYPFRFHLSISCCNTCRCGRLTVLVLAHWSHWTLFRTLFLVRLTVLAIMIKLWLGHWPHITWFHCWPHMNTLGRLTVLVIIHRFGKNTLNSTYNEVTLNEKLAITKENLCTKYSPFTYKYITLNEKLPIMRQNLHIFFFQNRQSWV